MADGSKIEWTDATWNPVRGCTRVSPGCGGPGPHGGCYAEAIAARFSGPGQAYEGIAEMRVGKARAGRLLDGVEHNGMPDTGHDRSRRRRAVGKLGSEGLWRCVRVWRVV